MQKACSFDAAQLHQTFDQQQHLLHRHSVQGTTVLLLMQECSVQVRGQAQRGAEGWLDVLRQHCADLEVGLAQEHQHRVRQEREKVSSFNWDAVLSLHVCQAYLYTLVCVRAYLKFCSKAQLASILSTCKLLILRSLCSQHQGMCWAYTICYSTCVKGN